MTKEEYEKLLQSDYWKGYSYSLIKERNFTCEDCGRRFFNERNKLQVHHLVYRDVNPWSYKPEEMVVLCRDCHRKRHGLVDEPPVETDEVDNTQTYQKNYNYSTTQEEKLTNSWQQPTESRPSSYSPNIRQYDIYKEPKPRYGCLVIAFILLLLLVFTLNRQSSSNTPSTSETQEQSQSQELTNKQSIKKTKAKKSKTQKNKVVVTGQSDMIDKDADLIEKYDAPVPVAPAEVTTIRTNPEPSKKEKTTVELLEERTHANVVKQAQRAGVSTEGSTSEILDRITHANVVKQAQRAGVSTEGSTSEILDRITRKNLEKYQ